MFHRIGAAAYKADLNNILAISEITGNSHLNFKSVHIAGTNGKGSVSNMLASVFMEAGYKTGLFTSPHLKDFRERIRIDGKMIPETYVVNYVEKYFGIFENIKPSFFEWTTALAFSYFLESEVNIAIIETGLGGRLDSTNIISPELSIITNISFDHMNLLGDTIKKIAFEKAGIIKQDTPVVIGERQIETENVFVEKAINMNSKIVFASDHYKAERKSGSSAQTFCLRKEGAIFLDDLKPDLLGFYQQKNICTVAQSVEELNDKFPKLSKNTFRRGIERVKLNTGLKGRWDILNEQPLTIADIGHNPSGIQEIIAQLNELLSVNQDSKLHMVFGMVKDKDVDQILTLLPKKAHYYFCQAQLPRSLDAGELAAKAKTFNLNGEKYPSVTKAVESALKNANTFDIVFIGGSTFIVAEAI